MSVEVSKKNLAMLENYFYEGCKENCIQSLGLEVEHFIVKKDSLKTVTYYEAGGVKEILECLEPFYSIRDYGQDHSLIGLANKNYSITIEPAGQLEISIAPKGDIAQIQYIYNGFLKIINPILEKYECKLETLGYHPFSKVEDLPLIPKKRYEYMDAYFKNSGQYGRNMMRGTASAQISIDYCSEQDFILKYRVAHILMPAIKLLTDNTPVFEGEKQQGHLIRSGIWEDVDKKRCGILPDLFDEDFGFLSYAKHLWNLEPIFIVEGEKTIFTDRQKFCDLYKDKEIGKKEINHILSMTFLDVRLKNYIEMRAADCMPFSYVMAYMALVKGIFFHKEALQIIGDKYRISIEDIEKAQKDLSKNAYQASIYGQKAGEFIGDLICLASEFLPFGEKNYLQPFKSLVNEEKTLTEVYYEKNNR
ncbi:MAG TPA: glutamate-cysteine ligase family protein [Lachnospiraceae bacterium]